MKRRIAGAILVWLIALAAVLVLPGVLVLRERLHFRQLLVDFPRRATEAALLVKAIEAYHQDQGFWPRDLDCLRPDYIDAPSPEGWRYSNGDEPMVFLTGPYHLRLSYRFGFGPTAG